MGFLAWIVVGLIAGWLAGQVMKGGGYGVLVDIILGILGGVLACWASGQGGHDWLDSLDQAKSKRRSPSPRCRIAGGRKRL